MDAQRALDLADQLHRRGYDVDLHLRAERPGMHVAQSGRPAVADLRVRFVRNGMGLDGLEILRLDLQALGARGLLSELEAGVVHIRDAV